MENAPSRRYIDILSVVSNVANIMSAICIAAMAIFVVRKKFNTIGSRLLTCCTEIRVLNKHFNCRHTNRLQCLQHWAKQGKYRHEFGICFQFVKYCIGNRELHFLYNGSNTTFRIEQYWLLLYLCLNPIQTNAHVYINIPFIKLRNLHVYCHKII